MKAELNIDTQELVKEITYEVIKALKPLLKGKDDDIIFDIKGLTEYLKVSCKWIYERTHLKEIPHIKVGGQLRFRKMDINKWLDSFHIPAVNTPARILKYIKQKRPQDI